MKARGPWPLNPPPPLPSGFNAYDSEAAILADYIHQIVQIIGSSCHHNSIHLGNSTMYLCI